MAWKKAQEESMDLSIRVFKNKFEETFNEWNGRHTNDKRLFCTMYEIALEEFENMKKVKSLFINVAFNKKMDEEIEIMNEIIENFNKIEAEKEIELTNLEMDFVANFMETEYGEGCGYVFFDEWNMKITRGVMGSLKQKGVIIDIDDDWRSMGTDTPCSWISLNHEQLETYGQLLDDADIKWRW